MGMHYPAPRLVEISPQQFKTLIANLGQGLGGLSGPVLPWQVDSAFVHIARINAGLNTPPALGTPVRPDPSFVPRCHVCCGWFSSLGFACRLGSGHSKCPVRWIQRESKVSRFAFTRLTISHVCMPRLPACTHMHSTVSTLLYHQAFQPWS